MQKTSITFLKTCSAVFLLYSLSPLLLHIQLNLSKSKWSELSNYLIIAEFLGFLINLIFLFYILISKETYSNKFLLIFYFILTHTFIYEGLLMLRTFS